MQRGTVSWPSYWSIFSINTTALSPDFIFALHPVVHATQCGSLSSIVCVLNSRLFICCGSLNEHSTVKPPHAWQKQTQKNLCVHVFICGKYLLRCIKCMHIKFSSTFLLTSLLICCILLTFVKCWLFWSKPLFIKHNQLEQHVFHNSLKYTVSCAIDHWQRLALKFFSTIQLNDPTSQHYSEVI